MPSAGASTVVLVKSSRACSSAARACCNLRIGVTRGTEFLLGAFQVRLRFRHIRRCALDFGAGPDGIRFRQRLFLGQVEDDAAELLAHRELGALLGERGLRRLHLGARNTEVLLYQREVGFRGAQRDLERLRVDAIQQLPLRHALHCQRVATSITWPVTCGAICTSSTSMFDCEV